MPAKKPKIVSGRGAKPEKRRWSYPFDTLKKKGDWFGVPDMSRENSVRSQASKNQKLRHVHYSVNRVKKGEDPYKLKADGIVVLFESYQP